MSAKRRLPRARKYCDIVENAGIHDGELAGISLGADGLSLEMRRQDLEGFSLVALASVV